MRPSPKTCEPRWSHRHRAHEPSPARADHATKGRAGCYAGVPLAVNRHVDLHAHRAGTRHPGRPDRHRHGDPTVRQRSPIERPLPYAGAGRGLQPASPPGPLIFHPVPPPSDDDVAHVLATVRARVGRLLARRKLEPEDARTPADPLTETSPVLAGLVSASVQGRVALGPGPAPASTASATSRSSSISPRAARAKPISTASTCTPTSGSPNNRVRLEQLCRYLLRPPLAQDRLRLRPDGRVLVELKTVSRAGTSHFLFGG